MILHVSLVWIVDENNQLKFDIDQHCAKWVQTGPWYNTVIFSKLSGKNFGDFFKTGHKYRCELMCAFDAYNRIHPSLPYGGISVGGRSLPIISSTYALESLGRKVSFINNWLQCFEDNY